MIEWIEDYVHVPDGKGAGTKFKLREWQKREIRKIYDGDTRRAILSFGRKNGKTALSRDQAAKLFQLAMKMIRLDDRLRRAVVVRETIKQLYCVGLGTTYTALSADASTAMGCSPVFLVHDELGQVKGPMHRLYEAMETATSAHENPLSIIISTQAPADADLLSILIDDAETGADPRTVLGLYTAPEDLDPFAEATIKLANPAFGDFQNKKEILDMAKAAKRMPSREAEYRNLILNQRVEAVAPFVSKSIWRLNGEPAGKMLTPIGGLDLSEVGDLTAFILVSPKKEKRDGKPETMLDVSCTFWLPGEGIDEKSRKDRVQWNVFADQKHLNLSPGRSIEYSYVARHIVQAIRTLGVRKIAFDRCNMRHLRPWLIEAGLTEAQIAEIFVDFGQGFISMAPAVRALETALLNERIRHGMHPVLSVCAANAVVKMDEAGNKKLDKKRSRGRIDGMVALAMAVGTAETMAHERHVYDEVPIERICA